MTVRVIKLAAARHQAELRLAADRRRPTPSRRGTGPARAVALRLAGPGDAGGLRRLAALDDAPGLEGPVLLAFVDGDAVAGLSLADRRVVANPFVPAAEPVALLRLRADQLSGVPRRRRRWPRAPRDDRAA